jgi:hypothetical protein
VTGAEGGSRSGVGQLGRKLSVKAIAIRASRLAADDDGMTAIELAAAGGVICAAGIALYAGLKVRRRAPVVTWRAWSEAFPVRAVSWTLAVGVTLSILAGAAAVIDARIAGPGHRPRGSPGNNVAWPERLSLPELTAGPTPHPSHHRRGDARPGSPAASSPCATAYPAPTLPARGAHPPTPNAPPTSRPAPSPSQAPTPSPSRSPSPTSPPTPTPTPDPSPTPSPTGYPSPSPSPTGYASPTATATSSPYEEGR